MTTSRADVRALHRIRVQGRLDASQTSRLGEMTVVVHGAGPTAFTDLTLWVADQAALMGVLDQLYSLGATLIGVERLDAEKEAP